MTREEIIKMSDEEIHQWIFEVEVNSEEFIRRYNIAHFDYGLSRLGIKLDPTISGELKLDYNGISRISS